MSFAALLSEAAAGSTLPTTTDVVHVALPLLEQIAALHRIGAVALRAGTDGLRYDGALGLTDLDGRNPLQNPRIDHVNPSSTDQGVRQSGVRIASRIRVQPSPTDGRSADLGGQRDHLDADLHLDVDEPPAAPALVLGYRAWEHLLGHHDVLSDLHVVGLVLTSYATGLDLDVVEDLRTLGLQRRHLLRLNPQLHPVVAGLLSDLIEPDRHRRPRTAVEVATRLRHHRDIPPDLDLSEARAAGVQDWRGAVLGTLRERVFDLTRRNRALYFKTTASTIGLTEASVPLLLDTSRIAEEDLLCWNDATASRFGRGAVDLERWVRFEEAPYVVPALEKLARDDRRNRTEFGQGRLRLIIAFLRWGDPQHTQPDGSAEVVTSPLLVLPAELRRRKGVKVRWELSAEPVDAEDAEGRPISGAQVNPVLRHVLASRFGIDLPPVCPADPVAITAFVEDLERQVRSSDPAVRIELIDKPRITLIRRRAQLRVDSYRRRRARTLANTGRWRRVDHSYERDDWRPLGLALFKRFVATQDLPLRVLTDAAPRPRLDPPTSALADTTASVRERDTYSVNTGHDVGRHRWEVDLCNVTLASLGSRRTTLVRDYDALLKQDAGAGHAPFEELFGPDARRVEETPEGNAADGLGTDQLLVMPADDAQAHAVRRAVMGDSFIIQGPPGTGKSQTIANLIASLVGEGKRVLFVCEKRAALDVVAHRLRQVGLDDLMAVIHDSRLDRKDFVQHLGDTYDAWLSRPAGAADAAERDRAEALGELNSALEPLVAFLASSAPHGDEPGVRGLIDRVITLRASGVTAIDVREVVDVPPAAWQRARPGLVRVVDALSRAGLRALPADHPALHVTPGAVDRTDPTGGVRRLGEELASGVRGLHQAGVRSHVPVHDLVDVARDGVRLQALRQRGVDGVLVAASAEARQLHADVQEQGQLLARRHELSGVLSRWTQPLTPEDTQTALAVARQKEDSFFGRLSGRFRAIRKTVQAAYAFDAHQIRPTLTAVLTELAAWHQLTAEIDAHRQRVATTWGTDDARAVQASVAQLSNSAAHRLLGADTDVRAATESAATLVPLLDRLVLTEDAQLHRLADLADALISCPPSLDGALAAWAGLEDAVAPVLLAALHPEGLQAVDLAVAERTLNARLAAAAAGAAVGGGDIEERLAAAGRAHGALLSANAAVVAARAGTAFTAHVAEADGSLAGMSDADKGRVRAYRAGRKLLEREFTKTRAHRAIRELAGGDSGAVVRHLRPIWLMSPLSVSDTLPLDSDLFDAVVFDEASQIPVEDAVPSVFRGAQVIVVGDRMQLPPTRFFSTTDSADDEGEGSIVVDDDGHRIAVMLDADSFLTQADTALPSTLLSWHYRSRSESLIAYSNHAFYGARLATVPDTELTVARRRTIELDAAARAAVESDPTELVARTLGQPISFHRLTDGVYADRRNEAEAEHVAALVRGLLLDEQQLSIGVVAFSEAQQTAIEEALARLGTVDAEFARALEAEQERTVGGEYVGLFVKNLESVQGDERDIIVMSVCYGPARDGRFRMNFGPINQAGGERRLNVIFSRAKRHMAIVSSIDGEQITNTHNDGAANLRGFLTYAAAESVGDAATADAILTRLLGARPTPPRHAARQDVVPAEIAGALRTRGLQVAGDVGRSGFTIDLTVHDGTAHLLGILVEPPDEADGSGLSRYVAEQGVLTAFGWTIVRVSAIEWWRSPEVVLQRISDAAARSASTTRRGRVTDVPPE